MYYLKNTDILREIFNIYMLNLYEKILLLIKHFLIYYLLYLDDEDTGTPPPTLISPTDTSVENITIHVYKESSTGGHWCARIIFFILLAVLVGLIGIIIFEHRGTTDGK